MLPKKRGVEAGSDASEAPLAAARRLLRQAVAQRRLPAHATEYVAQRVGQVRSDLRRIGRSVIRGSLRRFVERSTPDAALPPDATMVWVDGLQRPAVEFRTASVRQVAEDNLAETTRLFDAAGVPFFVRDASAPGETTVGVDRRHMATALDALGQAATSVLLHVQAGHDGQPITLPPQASDRTNLTRADRWLIYRYHRVADDYIIGTSHACVVEFWARAGDNLRPPAASEPGRVDVHERGEAELRVGAASYPSLPAFAEHTALTTASFPVDVVYTWVDGADPKWRERFAAQLSASNGSGLHDHAANPSRYHSRDELRYSLRSLALYADFVRHVFIVTDQQVPDWLDVDRLDVSIVDHSEILEPDCLPTFNSHAIEARLHHIDGLAEHYLYFNDDFFLGRQVTPLTFFTPNGLARLFVDELGPIPSGPPSGDDRPVDSASKNVRDLLLRDCGLQVGRKLRHVPYPLRRSVVAELEARVPELFSQTARSRFRHPTDLNVPSCLAPYYAFATGRGVPGDVDAEYVNLGTRWAPPQMARLLDRRDRDVFCLNDTHMPSRRVDRIDDQAARFLARYFPVPSRWESPATPSSERKNVAMSVKP